MVSDVSIVTLDLKSGATVNVAGMDTRSTERPAPNHHGDHAGFSGIAGTIAGLTMLVGRGGDARFAIERTGLARGETLVDIGCGPGVAARTAATVTDRVIGVDPAEVMLRWARLLDRHRSVDWRAGAAEALPVDDGSVDVAWSLATVHHWPDVDGGLAEVRRALRPGGRFLAIERRTHAGAKGLASHGWTDAQAESFAASCADAGFVDVEVGRTTTRGAGLTVLAHEPAR
jgi:SAM-dependent methyltransferase